MTRIYGFHHLAELASLKPGDGAKLQVAARMATDAGCSLFELACAPVNGMDAKETADALKAGGITEASYCRFFPGGADGGSPPFGDPLGSQTECAAAMSTLDMDLAFIEQLRQNGVNVRWMTGPCCFVLGQQNTLGEKVAMDRMVNFLRVVEPQFATARVTMCVEYLRPGEDHYITSVDRVCKLIDRVDSQFVQWHGDIFHMLQRGEDPATSIRRGGRRLAYLHCHGTDRVAPGSAHDTVDWDEVNAALNEISYAGPIVPEPFGQAIRTEVSVLGDGLPPAEPAASYYAASATMLESAGIL